MGAAVLDAATQHIHHAAFGDLALQAGQELSAVGAFLVEAERRIGFGLGSGKKLPQLGQINSVFAVVVMRVALDVARLVHKRGDDERLQAFFGSICFHIRALHLFHPVNFHEDFSRQLLILSCLSQLSIN